MARKWSSEEIAFLKEAENKMSVTAVASSLGIHYKDTKNKVEELGLNLKVFKSPKLWTLEDEQFLKENYKKLPHEELSKKLNRPIGSIRTKYYSFKKEKNKEEVKKTNIKKVLEKCEEIPDTGKGMTKNSSYKIFIRGEFIGIYVFKEEYKHFLMFKKIGIVDDYVESFLKVDIWRNEVRIIG